MESLNAAAAGILYSAYKTVRPLLGPPSCRFHPTCSKYGFLAMKQHGFLKGMLLAASRLTRCHPWSTGGYDPVPDNFRRN